MLLSEYLKNGSIALDKIKALSVRQPFASQIAIGEKSIEWRSKPFNYRGPVVICASKTVIFELDNGQRLHVGVALCVVNMVSCRLMRKEDLAAACCEDWTGPVTGYAWELEDPQEVEPVPVTGIVAPWPWAKRGGHDLTLRTGWHDKNVLQGL